MNDMQEHSAPHDFRGGYCHAALDAALDQLIARLDQCMPIDRLRLGRRLREMKRGRGRKGRRDESPDAADVVLQQIKSEIESAERRLQRRSSSKVINRHAIAFDATLPIVARKADIAAAIAQHQVVVICGETGSGKTTQLPKICLELGRGVSGMIGHTQPRRIAARSVAARIAQELRVPLGNEVGYTVRFTDRAGPDTLVRIMTDGILLAELGGRDRLLLQYDTLIIDEAHERSLNIDFLLGYIKTLLPRRPDLKVIITSATIDPQRFSRQFNDAPIIEVSGRTHPVEIRNRSVAGGEELDEDDPGMLDAITHAVDEVGVDCPGDTLVFLSGEREIREVAKHLREKLPPGTDILPLYARLSADEQNRVFEPHAGRRIVLATNVAETSLTVPGIRSVIDPGMARISRYSANARVQRLPIERISQASAQQRAGRCGRVAPGICIRLYSEEDFAARPAFTDPEILRSNLASVILQMKSLQLGRIEEFPFIDRPRASSIREGLQTLHELGAIDEHDALTPIGTQLAKLPIDPRLGRMILAAHKEHALREALIITSALAAQDPRLRPLEKSNFADASHIEFADERSDFMAFLKLWEWWHAQSKALSSGKLRKLCESRYLSYVRMREWMDVHRQVHALAMAAGMKSDPAPARYEHIHRALLTGLLGNVGMKTDTYEYLGVSDRRFAIFPGSTLFKAQPRWVMAAELVETTRLYARTVARIHPEWIEQLAPHLVKRTHTAPYWNRQSAHVEAHEKVTLRGLTIIPKRRVHYGAIDLPLARETFIQHALVEGDYDAVSTVRENRALIEQLREAEHKARRRDVLAGPAAMYAFYDARIPPDVCNGPAFEKWRRKAERRDPDALRMQRSDVMRSGASLVAAEDFPNAIQVGGTGGGLELPIEYRHDPGHADDGVTLIVPVEALRQVREERGEWLVPGLLREKITALIKSLPKQWRVKFVPVPEHAETVAANITFGVGVLTEAIARELDRSTGHRVPREAWLNAGGAGGGGGSLPDHLRMNYRIIDQQSKTIASGRDLNVLRAQVGSSSSETIAVTTSSIDERFNRSGLTHWVAEFDGLPESIALPRAGLQVFAYPAIVDEGAATGSVGVKLFDTQAAAARAMRGGLRRLFALQVREELAMHIDYLPGMDQMCLHFTSIGSGVGGGGGKELKRDLLDLVVDRVFLRDDADVRSGEDFKKRLDAGWDQLWPATSGVAELVARILALHHDVELRLGGAEENPFLQPSVRDMREQLRELFSRRFLLTTPYRWLLEYPRFLNAMVIRLQKLSNAGLKRDHDGMLLIHEFQQRWKSRKAKDDAIGRFDPILEEFRWLIEELRVSQFAQELRTSVPVSAARLEKAWAAK